VFHSQEENIEKATKIKYKIKNVQYS